MMDAKTESTFEPTPEPATVKATGRWQKLLVVATLLVPMVAAYLIYQTGIGMPTGTINKGNLLQPPVNIDELTMFSDSGAQLDFSTQDKKWRLVVPAFGACAEQCREALYVTRQVHTRLNEKYPRVERWLVTDINDPAFRQLLANEYPRITIVNVAADQWHSLLSESVESDPDYLMMDQNGFLMMGYQRAQHTGNDLLADLKRMLKFTREH
jgi:hypothetical protein